MSLACFLFALRFVLALLCAREAAAAPPPRARKFADLLRVRREKDAHAARTQLRLQAVDGVALLSRQVEELAAAMDGKGTELERTTGPIRTATDEDATSPSLPPSEFAPPARGGAMSLEDSRAPGLPDYRTEEGRAALSTQLSRERDVMARQIGEIRLRVEALAAVSQKILTQGVPRRRLRKKTNWNEVVEENAWKLRDLEIRTVRELVARRAHGGAQPKGAAQQAQQTHASVQAVVDVEEDDQQETARAQQEDTAEQDFRVQEHGAAEATSNSRDVDHVDEGQRQGASNEDIDVAGGSTTSTSRVEDHDQSLEPAARHQLEPVLGLCRTSRKHFSNLSLRDHQEEETSSGSDGATSASSEEAEYWQEMMSLLFGDSLRGYYRELKTGGEPTLMTKGVSQGSTDPGRASEKLRRGRSCGSADDDGASLESRIKTFLDGQSPFSWSSTTPAVHPGKDHAAKPLGKELVKDDLGGLTAGERKILKSLPALEGGEHDAGGPSGSVVVDHEPTPSTRSKGNIFVAENGEVAEKCRSAGFGTRSSALPRRSPFEPYSARDAVLQEAWLRELLLLLEELGRETMIISRTASSAHVPKCLPPLSSVHLGIDLLTACVRGVLSRIDSYLSSSPLPVLGSTAKRRTEQFDFGHLAAEAAQKFLPMILRIIHDGSELAGRPRGDTGSGSPSTLSATTSPSLSSSSRDESSVFCSSKQPGEDMRAAKKRDIEDLGLLNDEDTLKTLRTELKQWLQLEYAQERGEFWRLRASIVNDVVAMDVPHAADTLRTSEDALLFYRTVEAEMASRGWQDVLHLLSSANTEIESKDAEIQNAPGCEGESETDSVAASPASTQVETEDEVSDTDSLGYPHGEREGAAAGLQNEEQVREVTSCGGGVPEQKSCPQVPSPAPAERTSGSEQEVAPRRAAALAQSPGDSALGSPDGKAKSPSGSSQSCLDTETQACSGSSDVIARELPAAVPIDKPCPSTSTPTSFDVAAGVSEIGRVGAGDRIGCADRALTAPADPHQRDVSVSGSSSDKNKTVLLPPSGSESGRRRCHYGSLGTEVKAATIVHGLVHEEVLELPVPKEMDGTGCQTTASWESLHSAVDPEAVCETIDVRKKCPFSIIGEFRFTEPAQAAEPRSQSVCSPPGENHPERTSPNPPRDNDGAVLRPSARTSGTAASGANPSSSETGDDRGSESCELADAGRSSTCDPLLTTEAAQEQVQAKPEVQPAQFETADPVQGIPKQMPAPDEDDEEKNLHVSVQALEEMVAEQESRVAVLDASTGSQAAARAPRQSTPTEHVEVDVVEGRASSEDAKSTEQRSSTTQEGDVEPRAGRDVGPVPQLQPAGAQPASSTKQRGPSAPLANEDSLSSTSRSRRYRLNRKTRGEASSIQPAPAVPQKLQLPQPAARATGSTSGQRNWRRKAKRRPKNSLLLQPSEARQKREKRAERGVASAAPGPVAKLTGNRRARAGNEAVISARKKRAKRTPFTSWARRRGNAPHQRRGTQSPGPVASEEPEEIAGLSHLFADDSAEDFHEVVDETEDDTQLAQNLTPLLRAHLLSVQKALKAFVVSVHGDEKKAVTKILSAARNYGLNDDMSMNQRGLRDLCVMVRGALARTGRTNDRATKRMLRRLLHMSTAAIWRKSRTLAEAVRWAAADAAAKSASYSHRVVYWFNTDDVAGNDEYFPEHVAAAEDADAADTVRKIDFSRPAPEHAPLAGEMLVQSNKNLMLAAGAQLEQKNTFFSAQPEVRELADEFLCPTAADIRAFVGKGDPEQEAGGLLQTTDAKVGVTACCSEREEGQWAYLKALALVRQMEQRAGFTADGLEVARFNDVSVSAVRNRVARMSLWLLAGGNQSRGSFLKAILALHVMQEFGLRLLSDDIELGRSGAAGEPRTPKRAPVRARIRQTLDVSADLLTLSDGDLVRSLLVKEGDLRTVLRILHECPGTFDVADRTIFWRVLSAGVTRVVSWIKGAQHRLERGLNSKLSSKFLPPPPVDVHVGLRPFVVPKKFTHRPRREIVAASARWALNRGVWITDLTALADARFRMPGINFYQFPNDMNDSLGRLVAAHAGRDGLLPEMALDVLPDAEKSDAEHLNKALRLEKLLQAYTAEGFAGPRIVVEGENSAGRTSKNESLLLRTQARFGDLRAEILAQGGGHGRQTGAHTTTSLEKTFYSVAGLRDLLRGPTQTDVGDGGTTETESHGASEGGHESSGIAVAEGSPGALGSGHQHQDNYYARWIAVLMACLVPVLAVLGLLIAQLVGLDTELREKRPDENVTAARAEERTSSCVVQSRGDTDGLTFSDPLRQLQESGHADESSTLTFVESTGCPPGKGKEQGACESRAGLEPSCSLALLGRTKAYEDSDEHEVHAYLGNSTYLPIRC